MRPKYRASSAITTHCDVNAFVDATPISGPGVQINAAVGLAGNRAADDVANRQRRVALAFHFAQGGQRIDRFAALRDGEQHRVGRHRRVAIPQLARVFDFDRNSRERLDHVFAHQGRVPARAAGREHDPVDRPQLLRREIQAAEHGRRLRRG